MCNEKLKRRSFIQLGLGAASTPLWMPSGRIFASTGAPEFMLHIHLGSWCGLSSGMVQPQKRGEWPSGAHVRGNSSGSTNPLMNLHYGMNNFVFHEYSRPLAEVHDHLMMATISSGSLAHPDAQAIQQSGNLPNASGAGWLAAFAHMTGKGAGKQLIVSNAPNSAKPNSYTPNQVSMSANSVNEFNAASRDGNQVPKIGDEDIESKAFWDLYKTRFSAAELDNIQRSSSETEKSDVEYTLKTLTEGFPGYNRNDPDYKSLEAALNRASMISKLNDLKEGSTNIIRKGTLLNDNTFRNQLILAGMLAKKSTSSGMSITVGGGDLHNGGSDVVTANSSAKMWTQIVQFWDWVKSQNLDDKILVCVTHEFGRTPYNGTSRSMDVFDGDKNVTVDAKGRDHSLLTGMMFLNRNIPNGRVGGMGAGHTPLGSNNLRGMANPDIEGYTSANVMGSLFFRLFGEKLGGDDRQLREYWNNFDSHIKIITG